MFKEIETRSKSDLVKKQIMDLILNGVYKPEDKLPVENELAKLFNVSRATIRQAIAELKLMGIVEVRHGDGTYIKEVDVNFYMEPLLPMLLFSEKKINELYDARKYVEMGTAALAAQNRTDDQLSKLENLHSEMVKLKKEKKLKKYSVLIEEFHRYIAEISANDFLYKIYTTVNYIYKACIEQSIIVQESLLFLEPEHYDILEAIRNKDSKLAEEKMREHIDSSRGFFLSSRTTKKTGKKLPDD